MKVPTSLYWRTQLMRKLKPLYKSLGDIESRVLKSELSEVTIKKPVYITSLARSGTTIITEILSQLEDVCSHTYGDFPSIFTPYWTNWLRQKKQFLKEQKSERSHQDRIFINNNSPEAFEEVLWMHFFPESHQNGICHQIKTPHNQDFNDYYCQHIKKHLLIKDKTRYIAKANYNINRIKLILDIFPDACFIIPIRHPVNHIASLAKQHKFYLNAANKNPRINKQLLASGHFEFGDHRQIIDFNNATYTQTVLECWQNNQEIAGWSHYWNGLYQQIYDLKHSSKKFNQAIKFIKYEDLCTDSEKTIINIFQHGHFNSSTALITKYKNKLSFPKYYQLGFNQKEIDTILDITQAVSDRFGYNKNNFN